MDGTGDDSDLSEEEFFEMDGAGDDSDLSEEEEFFDMLGPPTVDVDLIDTGFLQAEFTHSPDRPEKLRDLTDYITRDEDRAVARGGFGEVWKCTYQSSKGPIKVAVKALIVYASDEAMAKKAKRIRYEIGICANLHHRNILPVYGYTNGFGQLMAIVSPWAEHGNLKAYLQNKHVTLSPVRRFMLLRDIALGLQYLHDKGVVHGDLTGPNVLIYADGTACLADFGLSLVYAEDVNISKVLRSSTFHGNYPWLAPELLGEGNDPPVWPTKHSDIYSFGGIMLQVLTSKIPYYYVRRESAIILCIHSGKKPERGCYPVLSDNYWKFMEKCWSTAIHERPSIEGVVIMIKDVLESLPEVLFEQATSESSVPPEEMVQDLTAYISKDHDSAVARGGFGEIWKCIYHADWGQVNVAVKSLQVYTSDKTSEAIVKLTKRIQCELEIRAKLEHDNILPLYGYTRGFGILVAIVNPWAENGNLTAFLECEKEDLTAVRRFEILRDIAAGLQYLHEHGVVHGRLAAPNVIILDDGTACLSDFGLSSVYFDMASISGASWTQGNFRYMAPELLGDSEDNGVVWPTKYTDIYSFGGIMLQVLTGKLPYYYYLSDGAIITGISNGKKPDRSRYPVVLDKHWDLIEQCWSNCPEDRLLVESVVEVIRDELKLLSDSSDDS